MTNTSAKVTLRILPNAVTILTASHSKNRLRLSAETTASVQKRQESVSKSKYPAYSASGGTKKQVTIAAITAIKSTMCPFKTLLIMYFICGRAALSPSLPISENIYIPLPEILQAF